MPVHHAILDRYGWGRFDAAYHVLRARGIHPILTLTGGRTYTMSDDEWWDLNRQFADRYPGAALKILSETNHGGFGGRYTPRHYVRRLKIAERAIRSVRPQARIIASAASPAKPHWRRYTQRVFRLLGRTQIDAAANIYPLSPSQPIREARRQFRGVRATGRPVWVTETGLIAAIHGNGGKRAHQTGRLVSMLARQQGARAVVYYRLRHNLKSGFDGVAQTAALGVQGEPTGIYHVMRRHWSGEGQARVSNQFSFGKMRLNRKRGTATLTVKVSGPGNVTLARTKRVKRVRKRTRTARNVKLPIRPKGKAKRRLAANGRGRFRAKVSYTPYDPELKTYGSPRRKSRVLTLFKRR